jgi:hypothetical protein
VSAYLPLISRATCGLCLCRNCGKYLNFSNTPCISNLDFTKYTVNFHSTESTRREICTIRKNVTFAMFSYTVITVGNTKNLCVGKFTVYFVKSKNIPVAGSAGSTGASLAWRFFEGESSGFSGSQQFSASPAGGQSWFQRYL